MNAIADDARAGEAEQHWDAFYRQREMHWSGRPNPVLLAVTVELAPGRALDVGCGEGADAIWLAQRGWLVTAVDVSDTALARAERGAAAAGVSGRIAWQQHDLAHAFPVGSFELVSAQYLHSPVDFPRDLVLRAAAGAVVPGGLLLIVGHAAPPPWAHHHDVDPQFPSPEEVLESLDLTPGHWRTDLAETSVRQATGPDGRTGGVSDCVVALTRIGESGG